MPATYAQVEQLRTLVQARAAFLGQDFSVRKPHRKVTLLFDLDESDAAQVTAVTKRIAELIQGISSKLHPSDNPRIVDVAARFRECQECSFLPADRNDSHICPWPVRGMIRQEPLLQRPVQHPDAGAAPPPRRQLLVVPRARQVGGSAAPGAPAPAPAAASSVSAAGAPSADNMCTHWRRNKKCPP